MLNREAGPRMPVLGGGATGAWTAAAIAGGVTAAAWLTWLAACIAAAATGGHVAAFGAGWVAALVTGRAAQAWPGTPTPLVAVFGAVLAVLGAALAAGAWRLISPRLPQPGDPVTALARNPQITELALGNAARNAIRLRPSLAGTSPRSLAPADTGLLLGRLKLPGRRGPALYASWEDTTIAVMAPRSGKTTALAIPCVLSAPGPVAATSVRADLWAATSELRAAQGGTVWVFDPQQVTGVARSWWWNPLDGLATKEAATRLASHFVVFVEDEARRDIWGPAAKTCCARCSWRPAPPAGRCATWTAGSPTPPPRSPPTCWNGPGSAGWRPACAGCSTAPRKPATASTRPPARRRPA